MPTEILQLRKGTQNENSAFTGMSGEISMDTTRLIPVVHDGVKPGGHPILPSNLVLNEMILT